MTRMVRLTHPLASALARRSARPLCFALASPAPLAPCARCRCPAAHVRCRNLSPSPCSTWPHGRSISATPCRLWTFASTRKAAFVYGLNFLGKYGPGATRAPPSSLQLDTAGSLKRSLPAGPSRAALMADPPPLPTPQSWNLRSPPGTRRPQPRPALPRRLMVMGRPCLAWGRILARALPQQMATSSSEFVLLVSYLIVGG